MNDQNHIETIIIEIDELDIKDKALVGIEHLAELLAYPAHVLSQNGTVAFPTETVYGLGANALDESAVLKIFKAKGRPSDNPLIVHISKKEDLALLVTEVPEYANTLMDLFWPGPITFVMKKQEHISYKVTGGLETVAVRMPNHPIALTLISLSGKPVAAPSANLSGKPSPTSGKYVKEDLMGRVDCIVSAGDCEVGLESTVLDVTGEFPVILRPGKVTQEQIIEVVGACELDPAIRGEKIDTSGIAKSPGMKYRHYAPEADVEVCVGASSDVIKHCYDRTMLFLNESGIKVGIMSFQEDIEVMRVLFKSFGDRVYFQSVGSYKDWSDYGKLLFDNLRRFDEAGCDKVIVRGVEEVGVGQAIMNRLKKASEGKVTRI